MRLIGTGKDPLGRYPKGLVFDSPRETRECKDLIAQGFATEGEHDGVAPGYFDDKRTVELAQAQIRGDALLLPHEREVGEKIEGDEHAIVHTDKADAKAGDDVAEAERALSLGHLGAEPGEQKEVKNQAPAIEPDASAANIHTKAEPRHRKAPEPKQ